MKRQRLPDDRRKPPYDDRRPRRPFDGPPRDPYQQEYRSWDAPPADPYFDPYAPPPPHAEGPPPPIRGPPPALQELPEDPVLLYEIPVPKSMSGIVIGPGGQAASHVRRQAKVQLHVRRTILTGDMQIVELKGSSAQCEAGVEVVRQLIQEQYPDVEVVASSTVSCHIDVLPEMIGPVLGAKGAVVKGIRDKTGASIKVRELNAETGLQTISILGKAEEVKEAYRMVKHILDKFDPVRVRPGAEMGPPPAVDPYMGGGPGEGMRPVRGGYDEPPLDPRGMYRHGPPPPAYPRERAPYPVPEYDVPPPRRNEGYGGRPARDPYAGGYGHGQGQAQPAHAAPAPIVIQAGADSQPVHHAVAGDAGGAQILVLQPDGTYKAAQFVVQAGSATPQIQYATAAAPVAVAAPAAAATYQAAAVPAAASNAALFSALTAQFPALAQHPGLAQYMQAAQQQQQQQQPQAVQQYAQPAAATQQAQAQAAAQQYGQPQQAQAQQAASSAPAVLSQSALTQMAAALASGSGQYAQPAAAAAGTAAAATQAAAATSQAAAYQQHPQYQQYYQQYAQQQAQQQAQAAGATGQQAQAGAVQYAYAQPAGTTAAPAQYAAQYSATTQPPQLSGYAQPAAAGQQAYSTQQSYAAPKTDTRYG